MIFYNMYSKNTILSLFCFIWLLCGFCVLGCNSQGSTAKNKVEVNDTATNSVNEPDNNLSSTNEWYKRFEGPIGNLQVVVNLSLFDTSLAGNYYYVKRGEFIDIDGVKANNNEWQLKETTIEGEETGSFLGNYDDKLQTFSGTWKDAGGKISLPIKLTEAYNDGAWQFNLLNRTLQKGSCPNPPCLEVVLSYFESGKNIHSPAKEAINTNELQQAKGFMLAFGENTSDTANVSLDEAFNILDKTYQNMVDEMLPDTASFGSYALYWSLTRRSKILTNTAPVVVMSEDAYSYTGGAHGMNSTMYYNYNMKNGSFITAKELFTDTTQLRKVLLQKLRKKYKLKPSQPLQDVLLVTDSDFYITPNFYLAPGGIGFVYNPYEIGPYAMGIITIFMSYEDVKTLLKPNNALDNMRSELKIAAGGLAK